MVCMLFFEVPFFFVLFYPWTMLRKTENQQKRLDLIIVNFKIRPIANQGGSLNQNCRFVVNMLADA